MLDGLKPISGNHSIKVAEAQIFVPQSFVSIEDDFKNFQSSSIFSEFQKKNLLKPTKISFDKAGLDLDQSEVSGYIFDKFESNGELKDVFKLENILDSNRSLITLSTRKYNRWSNFKKEQLECVFNTLSELKPYINAVGFTYIDEFNWVSEDKIPVESIFDIHSELLNKKFLNSNNGALVLVSQGVIKEEKTEEKTELLFNNDLKKVRISHQFLIRLNKPIRILKKEETKALEEYFEIVHDEHKKFICGLLTNECKELIGLTN